MQLIKLKDFLKKIKTALKKFYNNMAKLQTSIMTTKLEWPDIFKLIRVGTYA